jgi:nitroreductase
MTTLETISLRESTGKVKPDPVGREIIEQLLHAGAQAPNHYKVRPWRFVVLTGAGRERLGEAMAQSLLAQNPDLPGEALQKEREKPLRAPLIIAVGVDLPSGKATEIENIAAASAACQNILLAATELGLASIWRTGPSALDANIKTFLGFAPEQHLIGFLYVGYPENPLVPPERPGYEDRTVWMTD